MRATTTGSTSTFLSHVRPNTHGPRNFHGNMDSTKAVAVNTDEGIDNVSSGKANSGD